MLTTLLILAAVAFVAAVYGAKNPATVAAIKETLIVAKGKFVTLYKFVAAYFKATK